jgi:hypothetical protein
VGGVSQRNCVRRTRDSAVRSGALRRPDDDGGEHQETDTNTVPENTVRHRSLTPAGPWLADSSGTCRSVHIERHPRPRRGDLTKKHRSDPVKMAVES